MNMFTAYDSSLDKQAEVGVISTIASNWRETGALGVKSVQAIVFEQWLALYAMGELDNDMELQDVAACHMEMAATNQIHQAIATRTRVRIAERRVVRCACR